MALVVAARFGSLPEASVAFSSLSSAGFNPVAGFNMNTPGVAGGMAPNAYPLLVPESEVQATRQFLSELRRTFEQESDDPGEELVGEEDPDDVSTSTMSSDVRPIGRFLAGGAVLILVLMGFSLLRSCS